nr:immunoglobulin light chain junction region [Macaca mulatta]
DYYCTLYMSRGISLF